MMAALFAALIAAAPASSDPAATRHGAVPTPPSAQARNMTDAEVREVVQAYLGSIDTPIGEDRWRALGARAAPILEQLAADGQKLPTRRARALEGLSFVGSERAPTLMVELARREGEPSVVRMSAMRGAGRLLAPAQLVDALKPVLTGSKDTHVRAAAAEVLAEHVPSAGCAAVAEQSARESGDHQLAFRHAVAACRKSVER